MLYQGLSLQANPHDHSVGAVVHPQDVSSLHVRD